mgnify:FL=1
MRKRLIPEDRPVSDSPDDVWLRLDERADVEISSEDAAHPIESALSPGTGTGTGTGWRAAVPGRQTIRLIFVQPQELHRIRLRFVETAVQRTQEYLLRWSADGQTFHEIVRQQWNFSPQGSTSQTEDHQVDLPGAKVLELIITPDIGNQAALASLAEMRLG